MTAMATPSPARPSAIARQPSVARPSAAFLGLVGLVVGASITVRLALLGRQSYWADELFSVHESAGSPGDLVRAGASEVHPPFYAALLWVWIRIGGPGETWTRLLSTLFAVIAVAVTYHGLRVTGLGQHLRWALTAVTAAGGASIVYSLETRSYALLMLAATGLTAATLRAAVLILDGAGSEPDHRLRSARWAWAGWATVAATTHLFGAGLAVAAMAGLAGLTLTRTGPNRLRPALIWAGLAVLACSLQLAWVRAGSTRPGFPEGTDWIAAPRAHDLRDLLTTVFGAGSLQVHKDGFAWTGPLGLIAVAGLVVTAAIGGLRSRRRPGPEPADRQGAVGGRPEAVAAAVLLGLAALVIAAAFAVSQFDHLWTLRNLLVVTPALTWGSVCLAATAARTEAGIRWVAGATVALAGLALGPITLGLAQPYKSDFRGLVDHLVAVQEQRPDLTVTALGTPPPGELRYAAPAVGDRRWRALTGRLTVVPVNDRAAVVRTAGPQVVIFYHGLTDPRPARELAAFAARLGGPGRCRTVPIPGVGVLQCQ